MVTIADRLQEIITDIWYSTHYAILKHQICNCNKGRVYPHLSRSGDVDATRPHFSFSLSEYNSLAIVVEVIFTRVRAPKPNTGPPSVHHVYTSTEREQRLFNMCAPDKSKESKQDEVTCSSQNVSKEWQRCISLPCLEANTFAQKAKYMACGVVAGVGINAFSLVFPLLLFPEAATKTYLPASYVYDEEISRFDNTFLTYGTDYMIAFAMAIQIYLFPKAKNEKDATLSFRSKALLGSYAASVFFGGFSHQFYMTCEMRQTWHFRLLWTLCVGFVTAASGIMGAIATELVRKDETLGLAFMPAIPAWFWAGFGMTATMATVLGDFSFQRPACDIFVAGVTQSPGTFYLMAMLAFGLPTFRLNRWTRYQGLVGFIMMSLTLPSFPLAVQYTNLTLGQVNGLLHCWLTIAWTTQGVTLRRICEALQQAQEPPTPAVPVKKRHHKVA